MNAQLLIQSLLAEHRRAAVLWSSGKDSQVLLHLVRQVRPEVPVIFLREPWQPHRYAFAQAMLADWRVTEVHDMTPSASYVCSRNGHTSIIHRFQMGAKGLDLPVDLVEIEGEELVCGLDVMARPHGSTHCPWDLLLSGSRSADADPLLGPMPLSAHVIRQPGFPTTAFPLRDWSDAAVWDYIETEQVPYQTDRYEKTPEGWRERADKRGNPDYLAGCMRCMEPGDSPTVPCPKFGTVNRVAAHLPRIENPLPFYITAP